MTVSSDLNIGSRIYANNLILWYKSQITIWGSAALNNFHHLLLRICIGNYWVWETIMCKLSFVGRYTLLERYASLSIGPSTSPSVGVFFHLIVLVQFLDFALFFFQVFTK